MDFELPQMGEGIYEVEVVGWLVKPGDAVRRGQSLLEVMSDKATMEVPAPFAGTIKKTLAEVGDKIKVGQKILAYDPAASAKSETDGTPAKQPKAAERAVAAPARPAAAKASYRGPHGAPPASPAVRKLARRMEIDLASVKGSGPGGRILLDDLADHLDAAPSVRPARAAAPKLDYGRPGTRIKFQGMRRKIAEHMVHAVHTIPHYSYVDECNVTDLVRLRKSLRDVFAEQGVKLTYLAFFVKAAALALKQVPIVNSSLNEEDEEIVLHDRYDVGIAVATPGGLIVPVVRDADSRSLAEIAREIERLSTEARAGRAKLEDLRGGTFTVTSVGNIGGMISTPVINHPQVAILGVGKVVRRPVYDESNALVPADIVYLSFSFDHRIVDGAVGAAFGNEIVQILSNPALMLLEGGVNRAMMDPAHNDLDR